MSFKIGKFVVKEELPKSVAVGAVLYDQKMQKFIVVGIATQDGRLLGTTTPHCGFCSEKEFKILLKEFHKTMGGGSKVESASFDSGPSAESWLVEGLGLSEAEKNTVFQELDKAFSDCFEFKRQGKYLTSNLVW